MHTLPAGRLIPLACIALFAATISAPLHSEPIRVRYPQGSQHGFLVVKTAEDVIIATGDVMQAVHGKRVTISAYLPLPRWFVGRRNNSFLAEPVLSLDQRPPRTTWALLPKTH